MKTPLFRIDVTRADLKHCGKMPDAREEFNRSVREGRIESRHSIKRLERWDQIHMTYKQT